ncbi:MAG: type II secretion system protein J [Lautropia sp.]
MTSTGDTHALAVGADDALRCRGRRRAGACGFTLLELLIAIALMAVLALLSWRGLDTVLQTRTRLETESAELRSLTLAMSQMEEDLAHSTPVRMLELGQPELQVRIAGEGNAQSLEMLREVDRTGMPTRIQRVVYEVRGGVLMRGFGQWQAAALDNTQGNAVGALVWQPLLGRVREIRFRGWVDSGTGATTALGTAGGTAGPAQGGGAGTAGRNGAWLDAPLLVQRLEQLRTMQAAKTAARRAALLASQGGVVGPADEQSARNQQLDRRAAAREAQRLAQQQALDATIGFVNGIELTLVRDDGQQFTRIYSVAD